MFLKIKNLLGYFISVFFLLSNVYGQEVQFKNVESFFAYSPRMQQESLVCGDLYVPENWENEDTTRIRVAVTVLKNTSGIKNPEAMVYVEGGPGGAGIQTIWTWVNHPLRKNVDIVLFDFRGTGLSIPRLCPNLGKEFLEILAKNQSEEDDVIQKTAAAMSCKQDMMNKNIDISAYNSLSVAKDLNALKTMLGYDKWHVYSVSYGTYISQVYANTFPDDVQTLILDSSISDISSFYTNNTSGFMTGLSKVFDACKNDPDCNTQYPELEQVFYEVIEDLEKNPITVPVSKSIIESKQFTFNVEDFKVALQQALYHKKLIEVMPLLIYQFHDKNEEALGNLVAAFSALLSMDYGVYYCVSCNEVLPNNKNVDYEKNANQFEGLSGGISFYKSDFDICEKWNQYLEDSTLLHHDLSDLMELEVPVLVFAGEFDPITPQSNGKAIVEKVKNGNLVKAKTYGHVPGFSPTGYEVATAFITSPSQKPLVDAFEKESNLQFADGITLNGGVSNMGNSLNQGNLIFWAPLIIAFVLMIIFIFIHLFKLFRGNYSYRADKLVRWICLITSIIGVICLIGFVLALNQVASNNFYILAFGLPENYSYLFSGLIIFVVMAGLTLLFYGFFLKKIKDRSIVFSVIFSHIVLISYFFYWGIL